MGIIKETKDRIANCDKCHGQFHIDAGEGKSNRCSCYWDDQFLRFFNRAKIDENFLDSAIADECLQLFKDHKTICLKVPNFNLRRKWVNTAAFVGARHCKSTKIFTDSDIIEAVFNQAEVPEGRSYLTNFTSPKVGIFRLGNVTNKNFISNHIKFILEIRESKNHSSMIVIPNDESIMVSYNDKELQNYLCADLKDRGAYFQKTK